MVTNIGFSKDSALVTGNAENTEFEFLLKEDKVQLKEVSVTACNLGTTFSKSATLKTENISHTGLIKMACCNLHDCHFVTDSVDILVIGIQ